MPAIGATTFARRSTMAEELNTEDNNAWSILAVTGSWCLVAVLVVAMRVYVRTVMVRYFGWDDIAAVLTMVFGVAIWACFVGESYSALGKHWQAITHEEMQSYMKWQFAHGMMMVWALHGMKIAFVLFLLRLSQSKFFRRMLCAVVGFMILYTTVSCLTILLACHPISVNWNWKPASCIPLSAYKGLGMSYSILGMLTDAFLALAPVPVISRMQLNTKTKICLFMAFGMGLATVACGAVKTYHLYYYFGNRDRLYRNRFFVWGALELYVGIIAASLVSLKPLIASFVDKAKSTLVTSVAIVKLVHHGSPRVQTPPQPNLNEMDEKHEQQLQLNTQNFPRIQICSVSDYELPEVPVVPEQPKVFRVDIPEQLPNPRSSSPVLPQSPKLKQKRRPTPLNSEAFARRDTLELPCMGGVLRSPSPTFLPTGTELDFLNLIKARDPEMLQQEQEQKEESQSRPLSSTTDSETTPNSTACSTARSSLVVPNICGILSSPSPTFLPPGADLDFFNLIPHRDHDFIPTGNMSRRATMVSVPEDQDTCFFPSRRATLSRARYASIDYTAEATTATAQTIQQVNAGEVRRRPSMAPSANSTTSAFLCPPITDNFRESQMFFHVLSSGQFRTTAENASRHFDVVDELPPLSPRSLDPLHRTVLRDAHGYGGFSPVNDGGFFGNVRDRVDSSHLGLKKDE